uniref:Uncharacterized protein n=1 Tax=Oncorhynchus kisutch TaxID=8019 RepID=A0A8C7J9L7_ONCKI
MGCLCSKDQRIEKARKESNKRINKQLQEDKHNNQMTCPRQLLLLGADESGQRTIVNQMSNVPTTYLQCLVLLWLGMST